MTLYPGFSTDRMDEIFALSSRVSAMAAVEAAVAAAQGAAGDIPADAAAAIVAACAEPVDVEILADGWQVGTPVLGLLDALRVAAARGRAPVPAPRLDDARRRRHRDDDARRRRAAAPRRSCRRGCGRRCGTIIERFGDVATQARSFLQPADVTTVGFRTARWLDQLDHVRRRSCRPRHRCSSAA